MKMINPFWWLIVDLWHGLWQEPELRIDLRRIDYEDRATKRRDLHSGDVAYRKRVRDRIMMGVECPHPPLVAPRRQLSLPGHSVSVFGRRRHP